MKRKRRPSARKPRSSVMGVAKSGAARMQRIAVRAATEAATAAAKAAIQAVMRSLSRESGKTSTAKRPTKSRKKKR